MDSVQELAAAEHLEARARRNLGRVMLLAHWIMAPIYLGLLVPLCLVVVKFVQKLIGTLPGLLAMSVADVILVALSLVDLALVGNLVVIVIFSGWASVVSPLLARGAAEQRSVVDFGTMKVKLMASIAAIAGVSVLETFVHIDDVPAAQAMWQLLILLGIAVTGVLLALMERLGERH